MPAKVQPLADELLAPAAAVAESIRAALPFGARWQLVGAAAAASAALLVASRRLPPGAARALALLPLAAVNCCVPLLFDPETELLSRVATAFTFGWLGTFKAAGLAVNRGPLAAADWGWAQAMLVYALPIYPRDPGAAGKSGRLADSAGGARALVGRFASHAALCAAIAAALSALHVPDLARYYLMAFGLYGFIVSLMCGPAAALAGVAGLEVAPPMDAPWLSVSVADFWARRWNNTVGLTLRALVYDPVVEGRLVKPPLSSEASDGGPQQQQQQQQNGKEKGGKQQQATGAAAADNEAEQRRRRRRRTLGTAAAFVASGAAHEVVLAYIMLPHAWGVSLFFFAQAPLLQLESALLRRLPKAAREAPAARAVRWLATQAVLLLAAHYLFFPPLERRTRTAQRVAEAIVGNVAGARAALLAGAGGPPSLAREL